MNHYLDDKLLFYYNTILLHLISVNNMIVYSDSGFGLWAKEKACDISSSSLLGIIH